MFEKETGAGISVRPDARDAQTRSGRLALCRPTPDDADELFEMYSDPRLAEADPMLAHPSITHTRTVLQRRIAEWRQHGQGLWVLRHVLGPSAGELVGIGGCSLYANTAWNLSFSMRPQNWGRGYAQEIAAAGMARAQAVRPDLPIMAVVAARNARSSRAVERAGLHQVWQGPDNHDPDPTATMLLYADRSLSDGQIHALTR
ncbi:GNAT family N-acetyltransferase [Arthrobacter zhaoguopingii]|uniref:GNAT family N-acetyltransferase n=1 Tax=Arthrobacter zhaoguopingii TaxID=2681491 RepID=UPI001357A2D0|nr:GNAT family N-acetyltransferase [Arthrobacter zhaoguopingii]